MSIGKARSANASVTAQSLTGMRSGRSGRPSIATAGAISATLVVHETIPPNPSSTIDNAVIRRKFSKPPRPSSTEPTPITGSPPANAAVTPPSTSSTHSQRGMVGNTPRGMRASLAAITMSSATAAIGTQPG